MSSSSSDQQPHVQEEQRLQLENQSALQNSILEENRPLKTRKKYGNMLVLCDKPFMISLGPDYWCFIPAFTIFALAAYFITKFVFAHSNNFWFQAITLAICGGFVLSYLAVATSNPGVVTKDESLNQQEQKRMNGQRQRTCKKCDIVIKKGTRHCDECQVCIEGYDHHCPWTSKCIGRKNLCRFYWFLSMVPIFLIYVFIAFSVVMASIPHQNRHQIRKIGALI